MNEATPQILLTGTEFYLGFGVGLLLGVIVGYIVARRKKGADNNVTALQVLALIATFSYVILSFATAHEPSWIIATAILATGYGVKGGEIIEKVLERKK